MYRLFLQDKATLQEQADVVFYGQYYFVNNFAVGSCDAFNSFVSNQLVLPDDSMMFSSILLTEQAYDYSVGMLTPKQAYRCADRWVAIGIANALSSSTGTQTSWVCGDHQWSVFRCSGQPSLCVDCSPRCDDACPYPKPVINPCGSCSDEVASSLFLSFGVEHLILYPKISLPLMVTASRQSVTVRVNITGTGSVYCAAFPTNVVVTSALQVQQAGTSTATSTANIYQLTLAGLMPNSNYSVYCFTQDYSGHSMKAVEVLNTFTPVTTLCCRSLQFVSLVTPIRAFEENNPTTDPVHSFKLDSQPPVDMIVAISLQSIDPTCLEVGLDPVAAAYPKSFSFSKSSPILTGTFIIRGNPGCFEVTASAIGNEFYTEATGALTIFSTSVPPPPPKLLSALFANDGVSVLINFAAPCDISSYAGYAFPCSSLFEFQGSSDAICVWTSSTQVRSTLSLSQQAPQLQIGENVTMKLGVLKSVCPGTIFCPFANSSVVTVEPPVAPLIPSVSLSASAAISFCTDLILDPTQSTGQSGRNWLSVTWEVTGGGNSGNITTFLNTMFPSTISLVKIPSGLLRVDTYTIALTVQNFLLQSSIGVAKIVVLGDSSIPTLSIAGAKLVTIKRPQPLSLFALASPSSCAANSTSNFFYSWNVYEGITFDSKLVSSSLDPRFFNLPPYTLGILTSYIVQVKVSLSSSPYKFLATAGVAVVVGQSGVRASISGGSIRTVGVSDLVTVDASKSLDLDYPATGVLIFQWSCFESSPQYGSRCPNMFSFNSSKVVATALTLLPNASSIAASTTLEIAVVVQNIVRSSASASIALVIIKAQIPSVSIGPINSKYNAANNIILTATVSATQSTQALWSWNGPTDLSSIVLTLPLSRPLQSGTTTFQLAIAAGSLTPGLSYTFTFAANYFSTSSQVMVRIFCVVNSYMFSFVAQVPGMSIESSPTPLSYSQVTLDINTPPMGGELTVSPPNGTALSQLFNLATHSWSDDPTALPLSYVMAYYVTSVQQQVIIKTTDQLTYTSAYIGQGCCM